MDICLIYALISFLSFVVLTGLLGRHMGCEKETGESGGAGKENTKKEAVL